MLRVSRFMKGFLSHRGQDGQTLVEYSLILALVGLGVMGALTAFAISMDDLYDALRAAADAMSGSP
ncbi:MAG TPA: Flp family type IVb pilin [Dehalococcoidia bacterium]|nr:Flp family type IVb pilin [Dehalococcoidia bacterium]